MSNILNAVTGREKFFIQGDGVYSSITGAKIGIIENGVVKSSATGNAIAIVNSSSDDGGIDLSFITAGASDILSGAVGADSNGSPVYGSISKKGAATYTPGTSNQTIAAGLYLSGVQTIKGDSNLAAANIRAGKSIFGKAGTFSADATATAADILKGKTAAINGEMVTGTMQEMDGMIAPIEFYECASYTPNAEVWTGYKMNWVDASLPTPSNDIKAEFTFSGYVDYSGVFTLRDGNAVGGDRVWINTNPRGGEIKLNTTDSKVWEIILADGVYARFASGDPDITIEDMCAVPPDATILTQVITPALPAHWQKSENLTENLQVGYFKPKVGEIYSEDTSLEIRRAYPDEGNAGDFYLATSLQGVVEKITITGGCFLDDVSEPKSLAGEYTIIDGTCFGVDRIWYCPATTAQTIDDVEYSSISGVCIGCADMETGWDNETGDMLYEKRWAISWGKTPDPFSPYFMDSKSGENQSPIGVTWEGGWGAASGVISLPVLTADTEDVTPYGPTAWNGKQMTWQEREIFVTSDARIKEANGVWYREDAGQPITKNSVFCNFNGKSKILVQSTGSYVRWEMTIEGYTSSPGSCRYNTAEGYDINNMPNPFAVAWTYGNSDNLPVPVFDFGSAGWYPAESETAGLTIKTAAPQIGQIYNEDATVKVGAMYPAK
jgi:hypothetical protein